MADNKPAYKRILLKISGEALMGDQNRLGIHPETVNKISQEISDVAHLGVEIGIVVGGGNIFRGLSASARGMDRVTADYMGMLATCINSLALQDFLERYDLQTRVLTAVKMEELAEPFIRRRAMNHLKKGRVVIFGGGTGNPYFTTDTAATLRAIEIEADAILKATKVDGVYDKDPEIHSDAVMFKELNYMQVIRRQLRVMDTTAITLCMENELPIVVFKLMGKNNLKRVVLGENLGTKVNGESYD